MRTFWEIPLCRQFKRAYYLHHQLDNAGGNRHLWNVGLLHRNYTVLYPRRLTSWLGNISLPEDSSCFVRVGGVRLRLWTAATNRPVVHPQMIYVYGEPRWNDIDRGKPVELGEKPVPVPLRPPQIPHGLIRARTRASAAWDRRLTVWAMEQPLTQSNNSMNDDLATFINRINSFNFFLNIRIIQ
jgi:hypothetical protein